MNFDDVADVEAAADEIRAVTAAWCDSRDRGLIRRRLADCLCPGSGRGMSHQRRPQLESKDQVAKASTLIDAPRNEVWVALTDPGEDQ